MMIIISVYELDPCRNYGVAEHNLVDVAVVIRPSSYLYITNRSKTEGSLTSNRSVG